jgi:hypothetical protein
MQVIIKQNAYYLCGSCKCQLYYLNGTREESISGITIAKCINAECKNKGKVVKIHPQIIEIEPELSHVQN